MHWKEPAVKLYNIRFVMMFRLTPMFCCWASVSCIFSRNAFLWNLFIQWCPVVTMNLDLKQTFGPSGVLVEMWFRTFTCFVLKNSKVCVLSNPYSVQYMLILITLCFNCIHAHSWHNLLHLYALIYIFLTVTLWG